MNFKKCPQSIILEFLHFADMHYLTTAILFLHTSVLEKKDVRYFKHYQCYRTPHVSLCYALFWLYIRRLARKTSWRNSTLRRQRINRPIHPVTMVIYRLPTSHLPSRTLSMIALTSRGSKSHSHISGTKYCGYFTYLSTAKSFPLAKLRAACGEPIFKISLNSFLIRSI